MAPGMGVRETKVYGCQHRNGSKAVKVGTGRKHGEETVPKALCSLSPFNNPMNFSFFNLFGM